MLLMKKILVLCNGAPPSEELLKSHYHSADFFIAADGGGNTALSMKLTPDVVIGDLDSFDRTTSSDLKVIHDTDQETNDLEKALHLAEAKGGQQIIILGATGRRIDHTLKNISVLKQFNKTFNQLLMSDNFGQTQLLPSTFQQEIPKGTQVSLFPLSGKVSGITTSGLQYPLNNEALENGVRDGSSNEVINNPVKITHNNGDLLLFTAHRSKG